MSRTLPVILILLVPTPGDAQAAIPPARSLPPPLAAAFTALPAITEVVELPTGVLVHDGVSRQVTFWPHDLSTRRLVPVGASADSTYGRFRGRLFSRLNDSAVFVDVEARSLAVIGPTGEFVRAMAAPRPAEIGALSTAELPGIDASGSLYYRIGIRQPGPNSSAGLGGPPSRPRAPAETALVLRVNLATRVVDTIGRFHIRQWPTVTRLDEPIPVTVTRVNPLAALDDWTLLSNGTVAILRGIDYHVDFIEPDGTRRSGAKVPFEWQAISEADLARFLDTLNARQDERLAREIAQRGGTPMPPSDAGAASRRAQSGELGVAGVRYEFVSVDDLPRYRVPFLAGATRADRAGRFWVRILAPGVPSDVAVYDVLDNKGTRVDRVRLPDGRRLVGIGVDRVYLAAAMAGAERLEVAPIR